MASDTVPAAVPGPHDPPPSTAPTAPSASGAGKQPTGVAGLLAPIEATRTAFTLPPETATAAGGEQAVTEASSAGFTTEDNPANPQEKTGKTTAAGKQQSVIKAWMLAGAERWKKGADARNKRLDIQKVKAQARQVKETVTVNRSEKFDNGSGSASKGGQGNASGKSLNSKSSGAGKTPGMGPKNPSGSSGGGKPGGGGSGRGNAGSHKQDAGRSGNGSGTGSKGSGSSTPGRSGPGGGAGSPSPAGSGGKGRGSSDKQTAGKSGADSGTLSKDHKSKQASTGSTCGDTGGTGKPGTAGPSGKPGKDGSKPSGTGTSKTGPQPSDGKTTAPSDKTTPASGNGTKSATDEKNPPKTPATGRPGTTDSGKKTPPADSATKTGQKTDLTKAPDTGKDTTPTPRINLQTSREAGYRDGTRAAKAVAHTQAWRDGVRDGYRDTTEAAARETRRLNQAHAARKNTRTETPPMPQPATQTIPPQPTHTPGPQPIPVTSIDSTHVHLGDTAARPHISRGEVRTLRNFQQQLHGKTDRMTMVTEATRTLEAHANEQAKQVTQLLEQARGVKGGDKLVAALTKLADAAQVQATKAAEIHKRAARSAEACKALHTNSETRYGGIYKAVVDSPETSPAEMRYYREMGHASV